MGRFERIFEDYYRRIRESIFSFCEALNIRPTEQQTLLLNAVGQAQRGHGKNWVGCKSGQGPGKTRTAVISALWWCIQEPGTMVVVTAPTMRQLKDIFLAEARRVLAAADPIVQRLFNVTKSKIEICGVEDWGIKLVTATKPENFQGFHQKRLCIICEEASGIEREIIETCKGTLTNPNSMLLLIGNPNTRDCAFFDCFNTHRHLWNTLTFNAEETPKSEWFDPRRNELLAQEFGRDSDVYRIRVLGEFPLQDPNCVLSSEDLEKVTNKELIYRVMKIERPMGGLAKQFGMDFARYGSDESTIFRRQGQAILDWARFAHHEPTHVIDHAFRMQKEGLWTDKETQYVADAGGMGQGVMVKFHEAGKRIDEFHNQGTSPDDGCVNRITAAWFDFAKKVRARECYIPPDNILLRQLSTRQYFIDKKGKIVLESKDDYEKRGFDSPDRAEGCIYCFVDDCIARGRVTGRISDGRSIGVRVAA